MKLHNCLAAIPLLWMPLTFADWSLVNDSSNLSFVTTKATHIAEVNGFDRLEGRISDAGNAELKIDLSSVNTAIPIRDGRMQEHLFQVVTYPSATFDSEVDMKVLQGLQVGGSAEMELAGHLNLHGVSMPISAQVTVIKQSDKQLFVATRKPLVINASAVDLAEGVEKLRDIAGLPNISLSVTVTFQLVFAQ